MAVSRNHKGQRQLIRHSLRRLFANNHDVGKGLYIGGSDGHPNYHHRHHHQDTSSLPSAEAADAATTPDSKIWMNRLPTRQDIYGSDSEGDNKEWRDQETGDTFSQLDVYSPRKSVIRPSTPLMSPSSSSSSVTLSSILSKNDDHHLASSHQRLPQSPWSHVGPGHPRHKMSSSSAHSPTHQFPTRDNSIQSSPSSSSSLSSLPSPNTHLLNLGSGQESTLHRLHHNHLGSHLDPLPTTWDLSWNQTDTLCFNRTNASCESWDLFNPEENETSTQASVNLFDEEYRFWTLVLIIIPLLTVFGNVLVVMSVIKERSLKTVTNYFICSLAVADIMVAVIVMPFAVYMEVMKYRWLLHDGLCDAWVASDVLGCTASILNLTAICVDRFIAVTQPIKYAKHKNSKRVFIMLAITWVISVAIAAPIALGVNYSSARNSGDCQFFNSDFIIYSSMGSFYIPSAIMCFLYWKIYRVIRLRALKAKMAKQMREVDKKTLHGVIENPTNVANQNANDTGGVYGAEATVTTGLANIDNGRVTTYNTTKATTSRMLVSGGDEDNFGNNPQSNSDDNSDDDDDDSGSGSANNNTSSKNLKKLGVASVVMQISPRFYRNMEAAELITNPMAEELDRLENEGFQAVSQYGKNGGCVGGHEPSASTSGGTGQTCANEAETPFTSMLCKADAADENGGGKTGKNATMKVSTPTHGGLKKGVTKFNFHMRPSRKRKEKSSSRREKKATKTLAIVLGVFLACWVPFFTLNIFNAICIRYDLHELPSCKVDPIFFSLFQWLGYINSFLNPVIYTIFNQEFRKAFRRLLTEPCR